jgi:DNA-binding CsgD family transcriptional regulator
MPVNSRSGGGRTPPASETLIWLIDPPGVSAERRVIDTHDATPSPLARRIARMVSVAQMRYGNDPLFEALLNEVACLCAHTLQLEAVDRATAPPEGMKDLTPRERQVAALLVAGKSDREIGAILGVASSTAKSHSRAVLAKLELRCRHELRYLLPTVPTYPIGGGPSGQDGGY